MQFDIYIYTYTYIHTYTCIYTYIYIYTRIGAHAFLCILLFHSDAASDSISVCRVVARSGFAGSSRLSNMGTGLWSGAQFR